MIYYYRVSQKTLNTLYLGYYDMYDYSIFLGARAPLELAHVKNNKKKGKSFK